MKGNSLRTANTRVRKAQKQKTKKKKGGEDEGGLIDLKHLDLMTLLEKHGCQLKPKESESRKSRLSPTLADIIKDPIALGYFMEFLDCKEMRHFLDFYFAASTFQAVAQQRAKILHRKKSVGSSRRRHSQDCATVISSTSERSCQNSDNNRRSANLDVNTSRVTETISDNSDTSQKTCVNDDKTSRHLPWQLDSSHTNMLSSKSNDLATDFLFSDYWQPFSLSDFNGQVNCKDIESKSTKIENDGGYAQGGRPRTKTTILDAVTVYTRYISLDAEFPIGVSSKVRHTIEAEICKDKNKVDPACFEEAYQHAKNQLDQLQKEFVESTFGRIYQWQVVQGNKLRLEDILYNDASLFYFMEFLDQEGFRAILEFWLMAENFQQNMIHRLETKSFNVNEAVDDAMALYEKYFSMQSDERLIKDDKLRIVLENNICREDGPQSSCFAIPVAYAWTALKEILFPKFQQGDIYRKYLESLLKSSTRVEKSDETASMSSGSRSGSSNVLSSAGEADYDFLDKNADSLWYRPAAGRLALGHMDEFGTFVAESEPEPDQDVSKLSKAMRSFLSKKGSTKEKERERLALEEARQIIEDIQKVTNVRDTSS